MSARASASSRGLFKPFFLVFAVGSFLAVSAVVAGVVGAQQATEQMVASWYGPGFEGATTASGEPFNPSDYTAASKTLPFGTKLIVTYQGKSVVVRINDRGPYVAGRDLDLSEAAAEYIGLAAAGYGTVDVAYAAASTPTGPYSTGSSSNQPTSGHPTSGQPTSGQPEPSGQPTSGRPTSGSPQQSVGGNSGAAAGQYDNNGGTNPVNGQYANGGAANGQYNNPASGQYDNGGNSGNAAGDQYTGGNPTTGGSPTQNPTTGGNPVQSPAGGQYDNGGGVADDQYGGSAPVAPPAQAGVVEPPVPAPSQLEIPPADLATPGSTVERRIEYSLAAPPKNYTGLLPKDVPQAAAPQTVAPQQAAAQTAPQNATPQNATPQQVAPQQVAPQQVAPQGGVAQQAAPQAATQGVQQVRPAVQSAPTGAIKSVASATPKTDAPPSTVVKVLPDTGGLPLLPLAGSVLGLAAVALVAVRVVRR